MTSLRVEDRIGYLNFEHIKDGIRVAAFMRGRRRAGVESDSAIESLFKKGWRIKLASISKFIAVKDIKDHEKLG